jgi:murein tripeptide amidase MpaA
MMGENAKLPALALLALLVAGVPVIFSVPTQGIPLLNTSSGYNFTWSNLTCYNQSTAGATSNAFDFRANGTSRAVLHMTFYTNVTSAARAVSDYSSYANNGTLGDGTAANVPLWNATGKSAGAYPFDGINDIIAIPDAASLDGNGAYNELTLEAWIKSNLSAQTGMIITKRNTSTISSYQLGFDSVSTGKIFCGIYPVTGSYAEAPAASAPAIAVGVWYHAVCTYKDGVGVRLYVNGTNVTANTLPTSNVRDSATPVLIGARYNGGVTVQRWFNGVIDEVRVYNRVLSDAEILSHYNLGYSRLVSQELLNDTTYTCSVTPSDGFTDGLTNVSNQVYVRIEGAPSVSINSPTASTYNNQTVLVDITGTGLSTWYNWNGTNESYSTPVQVNFTEGANTLYAYSNNSTGGIAAANVTFTINLSVSDVTSPTVNLLSPPSGTASLNSSYNFTCNASDNNIVMNVTFYLWNSTALWYNNSTSSATGYANGAVFNFSASGMPVDNYQWNCKAYDNSSNGAFAASNYTLTVNAPTYDDVFFNSSFQSGNLYNVTYVNGDASGNRKYIANITYPGITENCSSVAITQYNWWFFFKMTNVSGKNITVNITNPLATDLVDRWPNLRPRYSYDFGLGNINDSSNNWSIGTWAALMPPNTSFSAAGLWFAMTLNVPGGQDTAYLAANTPYTVRRRDLFFENISSSPYVNITILGVTTLGLNLSAISITDPAYPDSRKVKVYSIANQHANEETQGSWYSEGAINFLLNTTNSTAATLRRNYIFRFVPIQNVDGVYNGSGRWSPVYNGNTVYDPNRCWTNARNGVASYNVVDWTYQDAVSFAPNCSLDIHGSINGESLNPPPGYNYFLHDGLADAAMSAFTMNISAFWENVYSTTGNAGIASSFPPNMRQSPAAIHPSTMMENTAGNFSGTAITPLETTWQRYGIELLQGIHGYYNNTANEPETQSPAVNLLSPVSGTNSTNSSYNFSCNASDNNIVMNVTFYLWNSTALWFNNSTSSAAGYANGTVFNFSASGMPVDNYTWNCKAYDNSSNGAFAASNYTLNVNVSSYDDVLFDTTFESMNLYNVGFVSGDALGNRYYNATTYFNSSFSSTYNWWFFFRMRNATGKNIYINLTNPTDADFTSNRWPNVRPRFSYNFGEGNVNLSNPDWGAGAWFNIQSSSVSYAGSAPRWYSFNISATQDTVWVAPSVPYTVTRRDRFISEISGSPYLNISVLTVSPNGYNVTAIQLSDFNYNGSAKTNIYITAQQHANEEPQGSWAAEGAIRWLLNDSNITAVTIRKNYDIKFIPIMNVDGAKWGMGRFTPEYGGSPSQYDLNRQWDDARTQASGVYQIVNKTWVDFAAFDADSIMDWHGSVNGDGSSGIGTNYHLGTSSTAFTNMLNNISVYWRYYSGTNGNAGSAGGETCASNAATAGYVPSSNVEWTIANYSAAPTLAGNNSIWMDDGISQIRGVDGYYQTRGANDITVPNVSLISPSTSTSSSNTSYNFTCNASDNEVVMNVTFYLWNSTALWYNNSISSAAGYANGTWLNFSASSLPVDNYQWNCKAYDNSSNGAFAASNFTLNVTSPAIPAVSIASPNNATYGNATVLVNISAPGASSIWYNWNGTNATYTAPVNITFNEGSNTLYAYANNSVGAENSTSVTFSIDTIAPAISITSPANQTYTNASIPLNISASGSANIWYNWNGTNATYAAPTSVNFTQGAITLIAYANDSVGNQNATNVSFFIDSLAPPLSIISPANQTYNNLTLLLNISSVGAASVWYEYNGTNTSYTSPVYVNFSEGGNSLYAYANDSLGNLNSTLVSFYVTTTALSVVIISPQNATYQTRNISVSLSSTGAYTWYNWDGTNITYSSPANVTFNESGNTLYAYANDTLGNITSANVSFFVDSSLPAVSLVSPTTQAGNYSRSWIAANATATDSSLANLTVYLNNSTATYSAQTSASSPLFYNFTSLPDGYYWLNATANDSVGNSNSTSLGPILLDTVAPSYSAPYHPANNSNQTNTNLTFSWTANDDFRTQISCNLTLDGAVNKSLLGSSGVQFDTRATSLISEGQHNWSVTCWDDLNNTATSRTLYFTMLSSVVGNASDIGTSSLPNVSALINGSDAVNGTYYNETLNITIESSGQPVVEFSYNFTDNFINFSTINLTNGTQGGASFIEISGVNSSGGLASTKTAYIYGASASYNAVCIKDSEGATAVSISSGCTSAGETQVRCDGTSSNGYTCTQSGTTLTISSLHHSAAIQFNIAASAPSPPSDTSQGGAGGVPSGSTPETNSLSFASLTLDGGTSCTLSVYREIESGLPSSELKTTITNSPREECALANATVEDYIPPEFAPIESITFTPQYSSRAGSNATFLFQQIDPGESVQFVYASERWIPASKLSFFQEPAIRAMRYQPQVPSNPLPSKPEQNVSKPPTQQPEKKPPAASQPQPPGEEIPQPSMEGMVLTLAFGAVFATIIILSIAFLVLMLFKKRKKRGL